MSLVHSVRLGLLAGVATLIASPSAAQQPAPAREWTSDFVVVAGRDTIAAERLHRTGDRVDAEMLGRQQGLRIRTIMSLRGDGLVSSVEMIVRRATDSATATPLQRAVLTFARDSVFLASGDAGPARAIAVPSGALPYLNLSPASLEQILLRARAIGGASVDIPLLAVSGAQVFSTNVRWIGADSAIISLAGTELRAHVSPAGQLLGADVPAQHVLFVRGDPSRGSVPVSLAPTDYSAPAGAPYSAEEVRVRNERAGIVLAGTLTMPRHAVGTRVPAVVMITGSGPEDRDEASPALPGWRPFRQIADTLGRRGIAVLRLDDRGVGGSDLGSTSATSADFADDIRAALAYLRARPDVDPSKLGLIGHSEGGMIAPMVAATDTALHDIVLIAGPSRPGRAVSDAQVRAALVEKGLAGAALDSAIAKNDVARQSMLERIPWLRFWFDYDPLPTARRVRSAVLIVQGATDTQVTPDQAEELARAIRAGGNRNVTVRIIPETNHLLVHDANGSFAAYSKLASMSVNPLVLGAIADWLVARTR